MSKILTVFGATEAQGRSVVNAILADSVLSKEYELRGICRDISKPAAKALSEKGVKLIAADMSYPDSLSPAVAGSHTVFLVPNFWDAGSGSPEREITQGKAVADSCKDAGVSHLVFSSLMNAVEYSGSSTARVPHFDSKVEVEEYMGQVGVPATFVMLGWYMENFFQVLQKGLLVKAALKQSTPSGKRILIASEYLSLNHILSTFAEVTDTGASVVSVSAETFKLFFPPEYAQDMAGNLLLLEGHGHFGGANLAESSALLDGRPGT